MSSANFGSYHCKLTATLTITLLLLLENQVVAQITEDDTTNTQVRTDNNLAVIEGGIQSGSNLFHSFVEFSLSSEAVANFAHDLEVENIFSRVTGGTTSQIDGLIQTQGNASLFLLNPAGVIFGGNAQLDIGGSFVVTTGDRLIFADGTEFSAIPHEAESLLTISAPIGLQYGSGGGIEVLPSSDRSASDAGLNLNPGNTLALLGGDISLTGNSLNTFGSNTEIASVKSGTISLQPDEFGWQFDYQNATEFGVIDFNDLAFINSSGRVNFQGARINLTGGSGILDFSQLPETRNAINLSATESINLDNGLLITQVGVTSNSVEQAIANFGGDIQLEAPQVSLSNGSIVSAGTLSAGRGGSITINAQDEVRLFGEVGANPAIITTSSGGSGQGGQINIDTGKLKLEAGSQIQASAGEGSGGTITVNARESINLTGRGILRSQDPQGNALEMELSSGFFASSGIESLSLEAQPQGASGSLIINTPQLDIEQTAQISVSNFGLADAGDIEITTSNLSLNTAGQIVANTASGKGGSLNVTAEQLIILDQGSSISTTAEQDGNGGNIAFTAENLALLDNSQISANANQGNGGNILINTQGLFIDSSSSITASSAVEQRQGNIEISTLDLNSRLATDYIEQSFLIDPEQINFGCGIGADLDSNQFRDVGRGGIPHNPFQENFSETVLADLGSRNRHFSSSIKPNQITSISQHQDQPIIEINNWITNSQGIVELIADPPQTRSRASCPTKHPNRS